MRGCRNVQSFLQLLFVLGYFIKRLSNNCIYWFCLKTIKPRFARELLYPSATLTPSPFGARLTPLNLASLEELHLLSRLRRQLPRGEAFRLACFPIRHTWRLYDFYIRAFRFQGVPWPFSSAAAICTIKNHVER